MPATLGIDLCWPFARCDIGDFWAERSACSMRRSLPPRERRRHRTRDWRRRSVAGAARPSPAGSVAGYREHKQAKPQPMQLRAHIAFGQPHADPRVIPEALSVDVCPGARSDRFDAIRVADEKIPRVLTRGDDGIVAIPYQQAELVGTKIVPNVLHRVEFR
jgi:hypothetical protein